MEDFFAKKRTERGTSSSHHKTTKPCRSTFREKKNSKFDYDSKTNEILTIHLVTRQQNVQQPFTPQ